MTWRKISDKKPNFGDIVPIPFKDDIAYCIYNKDNLFIYYKPDDIQSYSDGTVEVINMIQSDFWYEIEKFNEAMFG